MTDCPECAAHLKLHAEAKTLLLEGLLLVEALTRNLDRARVALEKKDEALRTCRSELSYYECTDTGERLSSVTEALDEADRALSEKP